MLSHRSSRQPIVRTAATGHHWLNRLCPMASFTPPPPPPRPPSFTEGEIGATANAQARRIPTDEEIQRILKSEPKGLENTSPLRGLSITAIVGYVAGSAMVFTGLSSQGKGPDPNIAQAVNVAGGFTVICLASICRHTKRLSRKTDN